MVFGRGALVLAALLAQQADGSTVQLHANPIRRVVNMLQAMATKVEKEGKTEEELYEKFFCYCKNGAGQLEAAISDAETKIPQLEASIKETEGKLDQLGGGTTQAKKDREEAKAAIAEATALREKEAAAFAATSSEATANIGAMGKALTALGGFAQMPAAAVGSFLQSDSAAYLRKVSTNADLETADRDTLTAFLSMDADEAQQGSGEIVGILKQLKETMEADLAETTATEDESIKSYDSLVAAKKKEIDALTASIEEHLTRNGEGGVALTNMKEDLEDTSAAMAEDKAFLADMDKNCAAKKEEWAERQKLRSEEILAIQDTIKMLNSDDALELFKKTLPGSASLLQLQTSSEDMKQRALSALGKKRSVRVDLIALALKGRKVSFDKVIAMIDEMVGILKKEQGDDQAKKEYCEGEMDKTEDEIKVLKQKGSDLAKAAEEAKGAIATLGEEIAALEAGIKALDEEVTEATEQRKEENTEYKEVTAGNTAAVELLGMAKNRLNKFYNPKLYKAALAQRAAQEPELPGAYKKSSEESNGVIGLIDMLIADVEKELTTMEVEEKNAQEAYEQFMKDSTEKRSLDLKSIEEKTGAKAEAEAGLEKITEDTKATLADEMATAEILQSLHKDCDWLLQNFDTRKEARSSEIEALGKAKAVLSGADYSLLQKRVVHRHIKTSHFLG